MFVGLEQQATEYVFNVGDDLLMLQPFQQGAGNVSSPVSECLQQGVGSAMALLRLVGTLVGFKIGPAKVCAVVAIPAPCGVADRARAHNVVDELVMGRLPCLQPLRVAGVVLRRSGG